MNDGGCTIPTIDEECGVFMMLTATFTCLNRMLSSKSFKTAFVHLLEEEIMLRKQSNETADYENSIDCIHRMIPLMFGSRR